MDKLFAQTKVDWERDNVDKKEIERGKKKKKRGESISDNDLVQNGLNHNTPPFPSFFPYTRPQDQTHPPTDLLVSTCR